MIADPLLITAVITGLTSPPGRASARASVFKPVDDHVILLDQRDRAARNVDRLDELPQRVFHQHDMRGFVRHVGAVLHGDADIGEAQRRGIVDAVADHGDDVAAALQILDHARLVGRQHVGELAGQAEAAR